MIHYQPPDLEHLTSFRDALDSVAKEKIYLILLDAPPIDSTMAFVQRLITNRIPARWAIYNDQVVGWCEIKPIERTGLQHVGFLGMGIVRHHRRHGIGRELLRRTIADAKDSGLEKIELEVFHDNLAAIRLYEALGFTVEGNKIRSRKIDGKYQDITLMAKWLDA
jgi:L-phenylalanine/L-methionine N-acetyltransferase